jgi:Flp pilus assembly protein CpaB
VLAASGALGGALALQGSHTVAVLTLARPVTAGQALTADDLSIAHLSGSGVHGIAAAYAQELVGETARASLPAGTLLTPQMLSTSSVPAAGQQVVAVALKPGAFPPELLPGGSVSVLQVTAANGAAGGGPSVLVPSARVLRVEPDTASGVTVVSLVVDGSRALAVAQASAAGEVSLSLLPVGR